MRLLQALLHNGQLPQIAGSHEVGFAAASAPIVIQANCFDYCQNVISVQENGKTVNYYLVKNDVSKNFHENLCHDTKKVTATGSVKEVNGKMELTATKIALAN